MRRVAMLAGALLAVASCDFDTAFAQYCERSGKCPQADAGPPDTRVTRDATSQAELAPFLSSPRSCWGSGDCATDEVCHPMNQTCVRQCATAADCPRDLGLDSCEDLQLHEPGGLEHLRICKCSGWRSCESVANNFICSSEDRLCEPKCTQTADCAGFAQPRVCDPVSGTCRRPCLGGHDCNDPGLPRCDPIAQLCTGCLDASDCSNRPDGNNQCSSSGACVRL
jgi:hypothetical protein